VAGVTRIRAHPSFSIPTPILTQTQSKAESEHLGRTEWSYKTISVLITS
jgi:hypothetical protein